MKFRIIHIELLLLLTSCVVASLWVINPDGNYEPLFALSSILIVVCEYTRRKNIDGIELSVINKSEPAPKTKITDKSKQESFVKNVTEQNNSSDLSVEYIAQKLNDAPPFQKDSIAESYIGIKVSYVGYLKKIEKDYKDKTKVKVNCTTGKNNLHSFYFSINLDDFPELKVLEKGHKIKVSGSIEGASGEGLLVYLNPDKVSVL